MLIHWDCLEEMKKLIEKWVKVDAIITDPPYWMSYCSSRRAVKHKKIVWDESLDWSDSFFKKCFLMQNNDTHIYVFCNEYCIWKFRKSMIDAWYNIKRMLVWVKNNHWSWDLLWDYWNKTEYILFAHKWRRLLAKPRDVNVLEYKRVSTKHHPTAKPLDLIEYLIQKSTVTNEIILDPFMWSWTTWVACKNTKRKFIGIEIDDEYFEIAKNRI